MLTVGLDFGTHQSKICIESKEGAELSYSFFRFADSEGNLHYTLPSIIQIDPSGMLNYGYIRQKQNARIVRYFKQATFTSVNNALSREEATLFSIWYLSYIIFALEEKYGATFSIQMGVPTNSENFNNLKQYAVRILLSAYRLVEEVFENDKEQFLKCSITKLKELTQFLPYDKQKKDDFALLIFPEAYACMMPLIKHSKIARGMSLMVDIGGGTTDISFFTLNDNLSKPEIYFFHSMNKGLNFLTDALNRLQIGDDSNIKEESQIVVSKRKMFLNELRQVSDKITNCLKKELRQQSEIPEYRLIDALKGRPIIYTGGGSTFNSLRTAVHGFEDIIRISSLEWNASRVEGIKYLQAMDLIPVLSTAYGLSISAADDNVKCLPFRDIFVNLRNYEKKSSPKIQSNVTSTQASSSRFDYMDDYDAWK